MPLKNFFNSSGDIDNVNHLVKLYNRYREFILYIFFGVLTTLVDLAVYWPLRFSLPDTAVYTVMSNCAAWICAVLFAFAVNKFVVFSDKKKDAKTVALQLLSFAGGRVLSLGIETLILLVGDAVVGMLVIDSKIIAYLPKLAAQVFVVIINYVISKFFVFKRKK